MYQYLESLYPATLNWVHQESYFQAGGGVGNIQLRSNQGLRIYGTVGDWTAMKLAVPAAGEYNLKLTSGGSNTVNLYLMKYTEGMDIAAGMTEENLLIADVVTAAQTKVDALHRQTVQIPLGAFGGLHLLQGLGPQVPVALIGGGVVEAQVEDELYSVGINQSRHSIRLQLTAQMQLLSPLVEEAVTVQSTLLLAESVIVGPVPQVYLSGSGLLGSGNNAE